jgi:glycine/D-amino acid oxidase-like deaminating enzyme
VVHDYGHGGAGITVSWGCAAQVREIVRHHLVTSHETQAAVLGAGVMGLTAARLLLDLGLRVTVYADRATVETTSFRAGGQWAVSVMAAEGKEQELSGIVRAAYTEFRSYLGPGWGVSEVPNYSAGPTHGLEVVRQLAPGLLPERVELAQMPFQNHHVPGFEYQTLLVEPPVFLPRLEADLQARGVGFVRRHFATREEVFAAVPETIVVNCTGMGARMLWDDSAVMPIKGQLAMLPAQPALHYLYGESGYLFPRHDHVVVGGTFEVGVDDETIDVDKCTELVLHMASLFGVVEPRPLPEYHIAHPRNLPLVRSTLAGVA